MTTKYSNNLRQRNAIYKEIIIQFMNTKAILKFASSTDSYFSCLKLQYKKKLSFYTVFIKTTSQIICKRLSIYKKKIKDLTAFKFLSTYFKQLSLIYFKSKQNNLKNFHILVKRGFPKLFFKQPP